MYIGKTKTTFKKRWYHHKYEMRKGTSGCTIIQNAWTKYGEENFEFGIIAEGDFNSQELKQLEEIFIKLYGNYNINKVSYVLPQSKNQREVMSKRSKERWANPDYKSKMKKALRGKDWEKYEEVKLYWADKSNGRGGNAHPGKTKIMKEFSLTRSTTQSMLKELEKETNINIKEGYDKQEIFNYWNNPKNANQAKYKHPGRKDIAKTFNISEHVAKDLINSFK